MLVDVFIGCGVHVSILTDAELVMRPETVVECEVMLFFIFLSVFIQNCSVLAHIDATDTSQKRFSLVERTYPDSNFDTHNIKSLY